MGLCECVCLCVLWVAINNCNLDACFSFFNHENYFLFSYVFHTTPRSVFHEVNFSEIN